MLARIWGLATLDRQPPATLLRLYSLTHWFGVPLQACPAVLLQRRLYCWAGLPTAFLKQLQLPDSRWTKLVCRQLL
uniref:Uncharacterized protein n=1 Tax=Rubinisphaera brasiliensis (strain ATCC 49424 / DSM 5305 / JCM 21570 / IAM 15109 / NBRC 103401 / IFAM 1448) TaxID=756272 RepID=F0SIA6_RUBBR|nr:hypothetical protein Plabr_0872 [Rubinisphaera brasiliensis DSM 5305]